MVPVPLGGNARLHMHNGQHCNVILYEIHDALFEILPSRGGTAVSTNFLIQNLCKELHIASSSQEITSMHISVI